MRKYRPFARLPQGCVWQLRVRTALGARIIDVAGRSLPILISLTNVAGSSCRTHGGAPKI